MVWCFEFCCSLLFPFCITLYLMTTDRRSLRARCRRRQWQRLSTATKANLLSLLIIPFLLRLLRRRRRAVTLTFNYQGGGRMARSVRPVSRSCYLEEITRSVSRSGHLEEIAKSASRSGHLEEFAKSASRSSHLRIGQRFGSLLPRGLFTTTVHATQHTSCIPDIHV